MWRSFFGSCHRLAPERRLRLGMSSLRPSSAQLGCASKAQSAVGSCSATQRSAIGCCDARPLRRSARSCMRRRSPVFALPLWHAPALSCVCLPRSKSPPVPGIVRAQLSPALGRFAFSRPGARRSLALILACHACTACSRLSLIACLLVCLFACSLAGLCAWWLPGISADLSCIS